MKIRTDELTGAALNWAVAKCEGLPTACRYWHQYRFADDWDAGGPIIERELIDLDHDHGEWHAAAEDARCYYSASTPLVAAMRCHVASKLGDEVEVPDSLVEAP